MQIRPVARPGAGFEISALATPGEAVVLGAMSPSARKRPDWMKRWLFAGLVFAALGPVGAVERSLKIEAPVSVGAGEDLSVVISAGTDAGKGEQVGFLQAEVSLDGGKSWRALCYLQNSGAQVAQPASIKAGGAFTSVKVRARAAFRDGLAGDVDFTGAAILWEGSWKAWQTPPAQELDIAVIAR
jgi:hypothetical protein